MQAERQLPFSMEAEQAVLGSVTIDPEALALVADFLKADDFYRDAHRTIYAAILALAEKRVPADYITICNELERRGRMEEVGGAAYIGELANIVPTSGNVEYYGRIVAEKAEKRRLIHFGGEVVAIAYAEEEDALEQAEQKLFALARQQTSTAISIEAVMLECLPDLRAARDLEDTIIGVPTGFRDLDNLLGGLQRSDLVILASRPGVGKTSLCLNIASNVAYEQKMRVGVFSMEMSRKQLGFR